MRGCRRHLTLGNVTTAGPTAFIFCMCLETIYDITIYFYKRQRWRARAHRHIPFPDLANGLAVYCIQIWCVARDPLDRSFTQVRGEVQLHVHTPFPYLANDWIDCAQIRCMTRHKEIKKKHNIESPGPIRGCTVLF